jgi:hypothetical protein
MHQLTIRGFDEALERRIRDLARREGISLNRAVMRLLRRGAGLDPDAARATVVGSSLDDLIGTWSDEDERQLRSALRDLEQVDEGMWS